MGGQQNVPSELMVRTWANEVGQCGCTVLWRFREALAGSGSPHAFNFVPCKILIFAEILNSQQTVASIPIKKNAKKNLWSHPFANWKNIN